MLEAQGESPAAQEALEDLCRTYWRPIYGFVRREGARPEEAKDITQGFFALILERKDFSSVRQEKGRLRSFLLAALKHFMATAPQIAARLVPCHPERSEAEWIPRNCLNVSPGVPRLRSE